MIQYLNFDRVIPQIKHLHSLYIVSTSSRILCLEYFSNVAEPHDRTASTQTSILIN